jgi:predicted PolB exonuclease-like 3'-5' exonuclease
VAKTIDGWKIEEQRTLCGDVFTEVKLVGLFFDFMRIVKYPQLVTFNGGGFDLPVLCYRAMMHGVPAPPLFQRRYLYRYGEDHLDLCDALSWFGSSTKMKLEELARTFGLPGKPDGLDGGDVENLVLAGRWDVLAEYCAADVLNTYRIWLRYELLRGHVTDKQFEWSEAQAAHYVGHANWPPLQADKMPARRPGADRPCAFQGQRLSPVAPEPEIPSQRPATHIPPTS